MEKKYRNIVVNCKEYCYIVKDYNSDTTDKYLTIYQNRQNIFETTLKGIISVTPKKVSKIILDNCL